MHTCAALVAALEEAGLGPIAPAMVGDYFPDSSPKQLAKKTDVCSGATPQRHAHFFADYGVFGSLDQNDQQVDEGYYRIINDHTFRIGPATFGYTIRHGDTLILHPMITTAERQEALANPLEFSGAGWKVGVSYEGLAWKRVECDGWC